MTFKSISSMLTMLGTTSAFVPSSVPLLGGFAGRNYLTHMKRFGGMAGRCGTSIFSAYDKDNVGAYSYFGSGGDELIIKELKQKIAAMSNPYHEDFGCVWGRPKPEDVYIILFNPGTEQEGVHTVEYPKGSGNNVILAFESKEECDRFSQALQDQQFFEPAPQEMKLDFLEAYCEPLGVIVQVIPDGMEIRPPQNSVENLGHDTNLMEQKDVLGYLFDMADVFDMEEDGVLGSGKLLGSWQ